MLYAKYFFTYDKTYLKTGSDFIWGQVYTLRTTRPSLKGGKFLWEPNNLIVSLNSIDDQTVAKQN